VLWLRFLTEIDEKTRQVPEELLANPDIQKAVAVVEESAFTEAQLLGYEKFWDGVRIEKTLINSALRAEERGMEKGMKKGMQEGMEKGMQEGMEKGMQKGMQEGMEKGLEEGMLKGMEKGREESMEDVALSMIADKLPYATISKYTGLSVEKIQELAKKDLRH
jgi:flagellar biosynthesis/type III secretory pathway protein FliH